MLININYRENSKSTYRCDICKKKIDFNTRYQVAIARKGSNVREKYMDLCEKCMNALDRVVEKRRGVNKEL